MFCQNCGAQLADNAKFCPSCGQSQAAGQQPNAQQPYAQQPYAQQSYAQQVYAQQDRFGGVPMAWHKFLVYFSLWAGALMNLLQGIVCLTGAQYDYPEIVYRVIPDLKAPDVLYGVLLILLAVFGVITAVNLLKLKKGAPKLLLLLYFAAAAASLIYAIWAAGVLSDYTDEVSTIIAAAIASVIMAVVMIIINHIYYKKRAHLFVN